MNMVATLKNTVVSVVFSIIVYLLLLVSFSFIVGKMDISGAMQVTLTFLMLIFSSVIGGAINARIANQRGLLNGLIAGVFLCILMFLIKAIFYNPVPNLLTACQFAVMLLFSSLGGVIGVNFKRKIRI